jgi:hypothetical protein
VIKLIVMHSDVNDRTDVNLVADEELPIKNPRYQRLRLKTNFISRLRIVRMPLCSLIRREL